MQVEQKLILEGRNDAHVISNLIDAKNLDITGYEAKARYETEFISTGNSKAGALKALNVAIKSRELDRIGIVIDADSEVENPVAQTWQSILGVLQRNGYQNLPLQPRSSGTIIQQVEMPQIGIWIMPDNVNQGYLEHFFEQLIVQNDPFLLEATQMTEGFISQRRNRFSPVHLQKAKIHTWLAWQADPELPMGKALRKEFVDLENIRATEFLNWLRTTFETHVKGARPLSI
jgi:hypothetical protein